MEFELRVYWTLGECKYFAMITFELAFIGSVKDTGLLDWDGKLSGGAHLPID